MCWPEVFSAERHPFFSWTFKTWKPQWGERWLMHLALTHFISRVQHLLLQIMLCIMWSFALMPSPQKKSHNIVWNLFKSNWINVYSGPERDPGWRDGCPGGELQLLTALDRLPQGMSSNTDNQMYKYEKIMQTWRTPREVQKSCLSVYPLSLL